MNYDDDYDDCDGQTQRYNLVTDEWELTGKINYKNYSYKFIPGQSTLYLIGGKVRDLEFICLFNEEKKRWDFCHFPRANLIADVSPDYYSDDFLISRKAGNENEVYLYNASKGDLAMPFPFIGKQKAFEYSLGVVNIAGTYIKFGTNNANDSLEFQCLDPRKDKELNAHSLKNISLSDFMSRFNEFANLLPIHISDDKWHVLPNFNRKTD